MLSRLSNSELATSMAFSLLALSSSSSRVRSIVGFERAMISLTEGRSSSESDISASEGSAVQPDERDWPAAGWP